MPSAPSAHWKTMASRARASGSPRGGLPRPTRRAASATGFTRVTDRTDQALGEPVVTYEAQPGTLPPAALAATAAPLTGVDTPQNVEEVGKGGITTTTPEDAAAGAAVGTGIGLVAGLLAAAAALIIPGVGPVLAGGALASALGVAAGTTVAGAVAGGAVGYLRDMGMPEQAASRYADRIAEGDYLISATIDSAQYDAIKQLLLKYNAAGVDVDVLSAGQGITEVRGADPAIAQELSQPPVRAMSAAEAVATGELHPPPSGTSLASPPSDDPHLDRGSGWDAPHPGSRRGVAGRDTRYGPAGPDARRGGRAPGASAPGGRGPRRAGRAGETRGSI